MPELHQELPLAEASYIVMRKQLGNREVNVHEDAKVHSPAIQERSGFSLAGCPVLFMLRLQGSHLCCQSFPLLQHKAA